MARLDLVAGGGDAGRLVQPSDFTDLGRLDEGHDGTACARASGAARAVQVVLVVVGRIEMHDKPDVVDVDAAGGHIGRDKDARMPRRERGERALTLVLVQVAVDGCRVDARPGQLLGEPVRAVLSADEEQGPAGRRPISAAMVTLSCAGSTKTWWSTSLGTMSEATACSAGSLR